MANELQTADTMEEALAATQLPPELPLIVLARALKWALNAVRAARKLHNDLLDTVIRLPMAFFDSECTHH